jgi:hypothetical protein
MWQLSIGPSQHCGPHLMPCGTHRSRHSQQQLITNHSLIIHLALSQHAISAWLSIKCWFVGPTCKKVRQRRISTIIDQSHANKSHNLNQKGKGKNKPGSCAIPLWQLPLGSAGPHAPCAPVDGSSLSLLPLFLFLPHDGEEGAMVE